jgi:hypothetical protein
MNNLIPDIVKRNQFLPPYNDFSDSKFYGTDSKELFNKNLKIQPHDWYYRTAPVHYTLNQHGYRTEEFDRIDWANSVVIFGCSNVFGIGVDDQHTISSQLSKLTGKSVINMGVGASSITYSLHNAVLLRERYPMPLAVVNVWTHYCRTVYYDDNKCNAYGMWSIDSSDYFKSWIEKDSHSQTHAIVASKTSKLLWENTKYVECSFFADTAELLNCKVIEFIKDARDWVHPGIKNHRNTAVFLAEQLQL